MKLPLKKIRLDGGTQTRARIHDDIIEEYAQDMKAGTAFPPLIVFHDGTDYWLGDGFHRWGAAASLNLDSIECEIRQGTLADAQWFSFSANRANGMRRTNDDKVRAVKASLRHCKGQRSDREIARHVGVSHEMVCQRRQELAESGEIPTDAHLSTVDRCASGDADETSPGQPTRIVIRKGKTYQMKVGQIGRAKKPSRKKTANTSAPAARTLDISISLDDPAAAAHTLVTICEPAYLRTMATEILSTLDKRSTQ